MVDEALSALSGGRPDDDLRSAGHLPRDARVPAGPGARRARRPDGDAAAVAPAGRVPGDWPGWADGRRRAADRRDEVLHRWRHHRRDRGLQHARWARAANTPGTLYHEPAELASPPAPRGRRRLAARHPHHGRPGDGDHARRGRSGDGGRAGRRHAAPHRARDVAHARSSSRGSRGWGWCRSPSRARSPSSGDIWRDHLGDRVHRAMPLRDQLELGIRPAISSDAFVQSYRPLDTDRRRGPARVRRAACASGRTRSSRSRRPSPRTPSTPPGRSTWRIASAPSRPASWPTSTVHRRRPARRLRRVRSASLPVWMTVVNGEVVYRAAGASR